MESLGMRWRMWPSLLTTTLIAERVSIISLFLITHSLFCLIHLQALYNLSECITRLCVRCPDARHGWAGQLVGSNPKSCRRRIMGAGLTSPRFFFFSLRDGGARVYVPPDARRRPVRSVAFRTGTSQPSRSIGGAELLHLAGRRRRRWHGRQRRRGGNGMHESYSYYAECGPG